MKKKTLQFRRISRERPPIKASSRWIKRNEVWKFQFFILWPPLNSKWRRWKVKNDFLSSLVRETGNSFVWRSWDSHVFIDIYYLNLVYQIFMTSFSVNIWDAEENYVPVYVVRSWFLLRRQLMNVRLWLNFCTQYCGSSHFVQSFWFKYLNRNNFGEELKWKREKCDHSKFIFRKWPEIWEDVCAERR